MNIPTMVKETMKICKVKLTAILLTLSFYSIGTETSSLELSKIVPENYQNLSACEKRDILWDKVEKTEYTSLPTFSSFGAKELISMAFQSMKTKVQRNSDVSPPKWKKYLHRRGSVAQVEFIPKETVPYTGFFKGSECALLRLSLTYRPSKNRNFAPGLALKVLRTGRPSANVSALYRLEGQDKNYNFFKNPLSNIVPTGSGFGLSIVNKIFKSVTNYPEELGITHLAENLEINKNNAEKKQAPRQIFFVPTLTEKFSDQPHDIREDFHSILPGTKIFKVYAVGPKYLNYDYGQYQSSDIEKFVQEAIHIGDLFTKTRFLSSAFGDEGIFFRHEVRKKE